MTPLSFRRSHRDSNRLGIAARAGRWSARHPRKAIVGWLGLVVVAVLLGSAGIKEMSTAESLDREARGAQEALDAAGFKDRAAEEVLIQAPAGADVRADDARAAIAEVTTAVTATGRVERVRSPLDADNAGQVSPDHRSALVLFDMKGDHDTAYERVAPVLDAVARVGEAHPDVRVEEFGSASANKALKDTLDSDFRRAEAISIPLTFMALLIVFGALVAAVLPLGLALSAVVAATGLLALTSHLLHASDSASTVLLLIGLAVGVDYSLFYVRREREERANGHDPVAALDTAAATSGRSVLVSGLTVIIAMAGMFITGQAIFMSMALATVLVVAVAVVGSLTVLPATLSALGDRVEKGAIPWFGKWLRRRRNAGPSRFWSAAVARVLRHPRSVALLAATLLIVLAIPATRLHTAQLSASQELPDDLPIMQTYHRFQGAFPGGADPATVVVSAQDVTSPSVQNEIGAFRREAVASGVGFEPITAEANPTGTVVRLTVPIAGKGQDSASQDAVSKLRDDLVPATIGRVGSAYVGGATAASMDFNEVLKDRTPFVFAFVLLLAFLLLLWSFRSLVVAATGVVLNLLSVAAAYGILVAVFQWGWGKSLLGLAGTGAIASWLPLFLFVVLLGLSMDYHVFSVSRIKEGHDNGMSTNRAIQDGVSRSAGVITSAALIMVLVFLTFATLQQTSMKQLGVGLAAAVLIDVTVVRAILLPAVMSWLGEWNWYLPRWLGGGSRKDGAAVSLGTYRGPEPVVQQSAVAETNGSSSATPAFVPFDGHR
jgi:RND superfamily putative drug exporter